MKPVAELALGTAGVGACVDCMIRFSWGFQKVDDDYLFNNDFSVVVLLNDAPHVILHDNVINQNVPNSVPQAPSAKNWICTNAILKKKSSHHYSIIHY